MWRSVKQIIRAKIILNESSNVNFFSCNRLQFQRMYSQVDKTKTEKRYYGFATKMELTGETSGFNVSLMSLVIFYLIIVVSPLLKNNLEDQSKFFFAIGFKMFL